MNFLAHTYLSGNSEEIRIGNFIGDFVKGNDYNNYSLKIKKGIIYHREIDDFTDKHKIVKKSKQRLQSKYNKYSGIIIDIFYDHFLAKNWNSYSTISLDDFSTQFYAQLKSNYSILPLKAKEIIPSVINNNWFKTYSTLEGIEKVLNGMSKRTSLPNNTKFAIETINKNYALFEKEFYLFINEIIEHFEKKYKLSIKKVINNSF
ncbi:MAG: acyl carrier protein phosphodiesterase [Bacteroidales bacterium]|nr:acyl carrier protein phosphodiesterase [Bacteroidales bacterium]